VKQIVENSLNGARHRLNNARKALAAEIYDIAAREAYMAAFNAAQALIFDRRGTVPRTHRGTHSTFGEIMHDEKPAARDLSAFLAHAHKYKIAADDMHSDMTAQEEASQVIGKAETLVLNVAELAGRTGSSGRHDGLAAGQEPKAACRQSRPMIATELQVPAAARRAVVQADPIILRTIDDIRSLYGDRMDRILLFGSRARGDEQPDSDYDIAVFLKDYDWSWDEMRRLADLSVGILTDLNANVHVFPIPVEESKPSRLFTFNILEEGIELWVRPDQPSAQ
jgi:uncharacterized protein (UPF0332 family)/predicted nucleotidyltransferase